MFSWDFSGRVTLPLRCCICSISQILLVGLTELQNGQVLCNTCHAMKTKMETLFKDDIQSFVDEELSLKDFSSRSGERLYVRRLVKVRALLYKIYGRSSIAALAQDGAKHFKVGYVEWCEKNDAKKVMAM